MILQYATITVKHIIIEYVVFYGLMVISIHHTGP